VNILRRLSFDMWYLRRPPWDSGVVPPEVEEFMHDTPPGRALDLGCGTGTSRLALDQAGWKVTGVDFSQRAINIAKQKSRNDNARVDFIVADAARLPKEMVTQSFNLILDIGCYHGLPASNKTTYLHQLKNLLMQGGTWLIYGFYRPLEDPISQIISTDPKIFPFILNKRLDGFERKIRPSAWFWFQNNVNP
jgi:ubiquinone/menaquinone biosynthesis C-methylase UbiE